MTNSLFFFPKSDSMLEKGTQRSYASTDVSALGTGNIYGDPLFVKTGFGTDGDYHVKTGSPGIDAGSMTGALATDLDKKARPATSTRTEHSRVILLAPPPRWPRSVSSKSPGSTIGCLPLPTGSAAVCRKYSTAITWA